MSGRASPVRAACLAPALSLLGLSIAGQDVAHPQLTLRKSAEFDLGFGANAQALAFSGDGRLLASASETGEIVVTDVDSGAVVARFLAAPGTPSLALSHDGTRLASVTVTSVRDLRVFAIPSGELVAAHPVKAASAGAWSPDGKVLAAQTAGAELGLFAGEDGAEMRRIPLTEAGRIDAVRFAADGQRLTLVQRAPSGRVSTLELSSGAQRVLARGSVVGGVSFAPDHWFVVHTGAVAPECEPGVQSLGWARSLVAATSAFLLEDTEGWRWHTSRGETRCRLPGGDAVALRSAGDLAAVARAGAIQLIRPDGTLARELRVHRLRPHQIAISGDNRHVVGSTLPGWSGANLRVFDLATGEHTSAEQWPGPRALRSVPGSPDILLIGLRHELWNPQSRRVTTAVGSGGMPIWSPDARWMWFGPGRTVPPSPHGEEVFDVVARTWRFTSMPDGQRPLAWQRGGELLLVRGFRGGRSLLSVMDGTRVRVSGSVDGSVERAEWSPDGRTVALLASTEIIVLDGATLAMKATGPVGCAWVRYLDAGHLVCCTANRVHVLQAATGKEVLSRELPEAGRAPWVQPGSGPPGDASADGRFVAVADALSVRVFEVIR